MLWPIIGFLLLGALMIALALRDLCANGTHDSDGIGGWIVPLVLGVLFVAIAGLLTLGSVIFMLASA